MPVKPADDSLSYLEALEQLADGIVAKPSIKLDSFEEFLIDVWSLGYEYPDYFKLFHVRYIANRLQQALEDGYNYLAVLPRGHFKSTVLGHAASVWLHLRRLRVVADSELVYVSFNDKMSRYHTAETKKYIRNNPVLNAELKDLTANAESSIRYAYKGRTIRVVNGSVFSFKRGVHTNTALVCDDILTDPENPTNTSQVFKIGDRFMKETILIPNPGVPIIVLGTPMLPSDLLTQLRKDERFRSDVLPALDPTFLINGEQITRRVLAPELVSEKTLLLERQAHPASFASERMLQPVYTSDSFIDAETLAACEDDALRILNPNQDHPEDDMPSDYTVGGFDVGKHRHPSHVIILTSKHDPKTNTSVLTQVYGEFFDGWPYVKQVERLNHLAKMFHLDKGYVDNTRGELEERGLAPEWRYLTFTEKNKRTSAQIMETYLTMGRMRLVVNERQREQILSTNTDLKAPETPLGHGESFISLMLATLAYHEQMAYGSTQVLGNLQELAEVSTRPPEPAVPRLTYNKEHETQRQACPKCGETVGWIAARGLCLVCQYRQTACPQCGKTEGWMSDKGMCMLCRFKQ